MPVIDRNLRMINDYSRRGGLIFVDTDILSPYDERLYATDDDEVIKNMYTKAVAFAGFRGTINDYIKWNEKKAFDWAEKHIPAFDRNKI